MRCERKQVKSSTFSLILAVKNITPWLLYPLEREPVPIVQEAEWATGPVWTNAENLTPTGIRSPERPARIQLLYRLSCSGTYVWTVRMQKSFGPSVKHDRRNTDKDLSMPLSKVRTSYMFVNLT
jgi:hypothetical protein